MGPTPLPLERVLANLQARLVANPNDHEAHYTLARAHYLAFYNGIAAIPTYGEGQQISIPKRPSRQNLLFTLRQKEAREWATTFALARLGYSSEADIPQDELRLFQKLVAEEISRTRNNDDDWKPPTISVEDRTEHVKQSIIHFKRSMEIKHKSGLYHLGLASLYLQYVQFRDAHSLTNEPEELENISLADARRHFFAAYTHAVERDLTTKYLPMLGLDSLVSYEAGSAFLDLVKSTQNVPQVELDGVQRVTRSLNKLKRLKPPGYVTPIIFTMHHHTSLADLLDTNASVQFDLDGDGVPQKWPWLKPTTGFLVWDDLDTGNITSGRQLFGSVTWWLFFRNGYQALDALDDNRDGTLTQHEINGIAVWFDRNTNGISEQGEVVSTQSLGITGIRTEQTGIDGNAPMNATGLQLSDGQTLPTYDWIASPID